jgi:hypothetical protein
MVFFRLFTVGLDRIGLVLGVWYRRADNALLDRRASQHFLTEMKYPHGVILDITAGGVSLASVCLRWVGGVQFHL